MGNAPFTIQPSSQTGQSPYRRPLIQNALRVNIAESQSLPPVTELLVDPITRKRFNIESPYNDKLLRLGTLGKLKLNARQTFVEFPKTIVQGLKGDSHFTFSDYLQVSNIPYYLGGMVLATSFRFGGARLDFARQGVGVGLYYLGVGAANKAINAFYKWRTGVDLDLRFQKSNGDIEKVFASADFPRLDLLSDADYKRLAHKMGVPSNIADPKREVNDQTREIISASRAEKLFMGNLLAAIGAGYIARSDAWGRLLHDNGALKSVWYAPDKHAGSLPARLRTTFRILAAKVEPALKDAFVGKAGEANPWLRRGVLGSMTLLTGMIFLHAWRTLNRSERDYESPFMTNLAPELAPEASPYTAAIQRRLPGGTVHRLPRQGILDPIQPQQAPGKPAAYSPNHYNGLNNGMNGGFRL